jgi:cystathionine beta-lyase family protein involved in aluminum resistance
VRCDYHRPYDTLEEVIGLRGTDKIGSLKDWGISYRENSMKQDGSIDLCLLREAIQEDGKNVGMRVQPYF